MLVPTLRARRATTTLTAFAAVALAASPALASPWAHLRRAAEVEVAVDQALETDDRIPVLIVAREQRGVGVLSADPTARRRQVADRSTEGIRDMLRGEARLGAHSSAGGATTTYLWAANAVAARVDAETLDALRARPDVAKVVLDRKVDWLGLGRTSRRQGLTLQGPARPAPTRAENYGLETIGVPAARAQGLDGAGVRVGHIDTGVDASHPALAGSVVAFKDFIEGQDDEAYDDQGHGTHSAGSIVARDVGVAPGAKLVVAKALDKNGSGSLSSLMQAMQWMLDPDGDPATDDAPALVSNSWGASRDALGDSAEVFRDVVKAWREAGIVPVFSSGNSGHGSEAVPGGYPESFAVGATDARDRAAPFSTGGTVVWDGESYIRPDVSAPGVEVVSTMPGGHYETMSGTSMACPHVAGAMALVLQARPDLEVEALEAAFEGGARDLGEPGKDERFGEGRIDVARTLQQLGTARLASVSVRAAVVGW